MTALGMSWRMTAAFMKFFGLVAALRECVSYHVMYVLCDSAV